MTHDVAVKPAVVFRALTKEANRWWTTDSDDASSVGMIGEGFDDSRLDTLFLAMPISWRGTLQQYVGRLHRIHDGKKVVEAYDYVDSSIPMLAPGYSRNACGDTRLWGYAIRAEDAPPQ
jgi:hypothetical protein